MRKIPPEAFDFYFSLGPGRSYQAVAERYQVSKRAVTTLALRDDWQGRLRELEEKAREEADRKKLQTLEAVHDRHMKALRMVFAKGVEALNRMAIDSPADAMKAIQLAIREERVAIGEPTDRTAVSVEEKIRSEYERWMTIQGGDEADEDAAGADDAD